MAFLRMYTGDDGRTHLEPIPLDFRPVTDVASEAKVGAITGHGFFRTATGTMPDLHPAPRQQYLVVLDGELEVVVSDGAATPIGPGDVIQVEDTWGEGHLLRFRNGCDRYTFFFAPIGAANEAAG